ncbi:MAG: hypothetical protein AAGU32_14625, partial [Bacillota bacterium]
MNASQKTFCSILLLTSVLLTGCSLEKPNYPAMQSVDLSTLNLSSTANSQMEVKYPADTWISDPTMQPLTLFYAETADSENAVNINVQLSSPYEGELKERDMQILQEQLISEYGDTGGIELTLAEMRLLNGEPIIYMESHFKINEKLIDLMIDQQIWTEEWIESVGGRAAILARPETNTITVYSVVSGYVFIYTGTYYDAAEKQ